MKTKTKTTAFQFWQSLRVAKICGNCRSFVPEKSLHQYSGNFYCNHRSLASSFEVPSIVSVCDLWEEKDQNFRLGLY